MKFFDTKTGIGYFKDQAGHIIRKADLPAGKHPLKDGFTYVECVNKEALDAIELYVDPAVIDKAETERKIRSKTRAIVIAELIKDGDLPPDFKDTQ